MATTPQRSEDPIGAFSSFALTRRRPSSLICITIGLQPITSFNRPNEDNLEKRRRYKPHQFAHNPTTLPILQNESHRRTPYHVAWVVIFLRYRDDPTAYPCGRPQAGVSYEEEMTGKSHNNSYKRRKSRVDRIRTYISPLALRAGFIYFVIFDS
ncbi:hypothetical protein F5Y12DRAFT_720969 [Xylaria sp. FL1777]|nr:hypothetical protein F5Y12DRAFT_720969 [Xylaria sp. FL1777]